MRYNLYVPFIWVGSSALPSSVTCIVARLRSLMRCFRGLETL